MKKTTFLSIILSLFLFSVSNAQVQTTDEIYEKYQEVENGDGYKSEMLHPGGYCVMAVEVKTKNGEVEMIKLSYGGRYSNYELEYYYHNEEPMLIKTKNCEVLEPSADGDGLGREECFEYMHYFNNDGWLFSSYKQGIYKSNGEEDVLADIGFSDNEKAFLEYERAINYIEAYKTNDWSEICD